jgi:hypothetical protein
MQIAIPQRGTLILVSDGSPHSPKRMYLHAVRAYDTERAAFDATVYVSRNDYLMHAHHPTISGYQIEECWIRSVTTGFAPIWINDRPDFVAKALRMAGS